MGTATSTQEKKQTFRAGWNGALSVLKELDAVGALNFGESLTIAQEALDAGLSMLSKLGLIEKMNITLSGWSESNKAASIVYTIKREYDEEQEQTLTIIHKDSILKEEL